MPLVHRSQEKIGISFVDSHGFGCEVGATDLDDNIGNLGKGAKLLLDGLADLDGIGQRDARQLARLDQDRAFVQLAA